MTSFQSERTWNPARPRLLVVACSDGRLQENVDEFLEQHLGVTHYDRLYAPGGAGALTHSGSDILRGAFFRRECIALIRMHSIETVFLLFHGPRPDGPADALCADYRRKNPAWAPLEIRGQQEADAREILHAGFGWPTRVATHIFRAEVGRDNSISFHELCVELGNAT